MQISVYGNLILKINPSASRHVCIPTNEKAIEGQGRVLTHAKVFRSPERNRWNNACVLLQMGTKQFS